jgi:hypothetical protein
VNAIARAAALALLAVALQQCGPVQGCSDIPAGYGAGFSSVPQGVCQSSLPPELSDDNAAPAP